MDLNDFLNSMRQIQKMGPLEGILKMLPGVNTKALKQMKADPKRMKHVEAIVLSMTPEERKNPGDHQRVAPRADREGVAVGRSAM